MKLENKIALVTGGARGIGREIALALAREGADVAIADLQDAEPTAQAIRDLGRKALCIQADVSEEEPVRVLVDRVMDTFGRIDILVNDAGIDEQFPIWEMPVERWDNMIRVNLRSQFLVTRFVVPHMMAQRNGRIICISSQCAQKGAEELSHYSAAKGGVISFVKCIARELAPYGILVNCVNPGPIQTEMLAGLTPEWTARKKAELPIGRFGLPEEIAPSVVLLASDPDGNLYTGQVLGPNCGDVM
jgi:3-oxoacyl-[acyl-carrier protein] reductase